MIDKWTETTYLYPLDGNNNLPIYVFNCDITSSELKKTYNSNLTLPRLTGESGAIFGYSWFSYNSDLIDFYNTIYTGLKTENHTAHLGSFRKIENKYFTIKPPTGNTSGDFTLRDGNTTIDSYKFKPWGWGACGFNNGDEVSGKYDHLFSFVQLYLTCIKTSDNVYYGALNYWYDSSNGFNLDIGGVILPDDSSKGKLLNSNYNYGWSSSIILGVTVSPENVAKSQRVGDHIRKIIGDSKKYDPKDPDPNIDDSDGDKNRTPTDDIGGDTIGDDDLPTISVMDTGLVTLYNPTVGELSSLGHFLWSDAFSVDTFKKLFSDPFDTLLGLSILPVTPTVSGRHNIYFGNIDSGVACNVVANQFLKVDMGTLTLNETYASAFDYAPSTQVDIYLPFIGSHGLNTNDVMGSTLHLIYKFDLLSGGCIAELFINHTSQGNKSKGLSYNPKMGLAYTFTGQCSCSIPLTSNNYNGMIHSIIQSVGTVGAIGASVATGNPALGLASVATSAATIGLQANTPTVQRSGSLGSSNALLSCLTPYLSVQRAHICKPGHFYSKRGIPSQVYVSSISSVGSGNYFQIADCADLHANGASDTELAEIKSILTSGAVW